MNDDVGQQRLHAAQQRVSPAEEQSSVAARVEAAQEGPDEAMRQALAASRARNVRPRTAESSRMEDVVPSRRRGSEEVGPPDDPSLTLADESQMGISEMAEILMSLGVAGELQSGRIVLAETDLVNAAVTTGFERGLVVDRATGWNMS